MADYGGNAPKTGGESITSNFEMPEFAPTPEAIVTPEMAKQFGDIVTGIEGVESAPESIPGQIGSATETAAEMIPRPEQTEMRPLAQDGSTEGIRLKNDELTPADAKIFKADFLKVQKEQGNDALDRYRKVKLNEMLSREYGRHFPSNEDTAA